MTTSLKYGLVGSAILASSILLVLLTIPARHSPISGITAISTKPASLTLTSGFGAMIAVGDLQHVRWSSQNYATSTVALNVIRKVADNPARYELVRTITAATSDDGDAVWVPSQQDVGTSVSIQIACALSAQECHASAPSAPLAIVDTGRYSNTASAYEALEQLYNNK